MHSERTTPRAPLTVAALLLAGCGGTPVERDPDGGFVNHNAPAGRIEGTILYDGPPPTVDSAGRPVGKVVLLLFRANNPPPPTGLATTAESVQTLPASVLFANTSPSGPGNVRASVEFSFPNIHAADSYQLRAFYSNRDELQGFNPVYSVRSAPQRGDVGGGAVVDPSARVPTFSSIPVGTPAANSPTGFVMPLEGAVTRGVTVFLGTPITEDRPVFRLDPSPPMGGTTLMSSTVEPPSAPGAARVAYARRTGGLTPPSTVLRFPANVGTADPNAFFGGLPAVTLLGGLAANEVEAARAAGVVFSMNPVPFAIGTPFRATHPTLAVPTGMADPPVQRLPWIFPMVLLVRLHDPEGDDIAVLSATTPDPTRIPRVVSELNRPSARPVVIFGSVAPEGAITNFPMLVRPPPNPPIVSERTRVVFPPVAFEIRGPNPERDWPAIVPRLPALVARSVAGLLPPGSRCSNAGLPQGRYGITVVTARGQTWSLPNELAPTILLPNARTTVSSQGVVVRIEASEAAQGTECPPGIPTM